MEPCWTYLSQLAEAPLALPCLLALGIAFPLQRRTLAVLVWLLALVWCAGLVLVWKLVTDTLVPGFSVGGFRAPSGHALLAAALLPLLLAGIGSARSQQGARAGFLLGLLLAVLVGVGRVQLGAHPLGEVLVGWLLGGGLSLLGWRAGIARLPGSALLCTVLSTLLAFAATLAPSAVGHSVLDHQISGYLQILAYGEAGYPAQRP